jgi:capsular exopolysaccharide synthesis family protein
METTNILDDRQQEETSFIEIFFHYFRYWKWFVLSVGFCVTIIFVYLRYTISEYRVYATVLIKDGQNNGGDYNAFQDLGVFIPKNGFDNEIELLQARSLRHEVVDSLNIAVSYFKEGRVSKQELYNGTPIFVYVSNQLLVGTFILDAKGDSLFTIDSEKPVFHRTFSIRDEVNSPWGLLTFKENPYGSASLPIEIFLNSPRYIPPISVVPINKTSNVVEISTLTTVPKKGQDFLNTLIEIYNQHTIEEKNFVSTNTIAFINGRLDDLSGELETAEKDVEKYKRDQGLTDILAETSLFLSNTNDYTKRISEVQMQLTILRDIKSFLIDAENTGSIAPANVGVTDPTVLSLIARYNEEVLQKKRITQGMTSENPKVKEYDDRIMLLKNELLKGVSISEAGMLTTIRELRKQENVYENKAMGLSRQERESQELMRQKEIKESLFIYLLQKREEMGLSLALATPNTLVVDPAATGGIISPQSSKLILIALLIGFLFPVVVIYLRGLFDNKLHTKEQLTRVVRAPFLGDVPVYKDKKIFPVQNVRSGIAEKFRIITSNLDFIVAQNQTKIIMVTSSYSGEGKSFFSQNLAMSLSTSGKKTLLIDLDMRKSAMSKLLEMDPGKGIELFLSDKTVDVSEIIDSSKSHDKNLDIIPIKVFPPNPAELLASDRFGVLLDSVRDDYDYVIIDTAPIALVADAYHVNKFTDATIYVTRAEYTYKASLYEIDSLYKNNKLHNLTVVLNAVPPRKGYGYGNYGYGYGYGTKHNYYTEE